VTPPPDLPEKDALIAALVARIEALVARIAELEAKLGLPPKTPTIPAFRRRRGRSRRSHPRPRQGQAACRGTSSASCNPTARRDVFASACQGCGADVSCVAQSPCEAYDRVEILRSSPT